MTAGKDGIDALPAPRAQPGARTDRQVRPGAGNRGAGLSSWRWISMYPQLTVTVRTRGIAPQRSRAARALPDRLASRVPPDSL